MKTHKIKPGFELIFSLSLFIIIGLPLLVFSQGTKNMEIKITNGDTVVNSKNIKELAPADREQALKDINNLRHADGPGINGRQHIVIRKRGLADTGTHNIIIEKRRFRNWDNNEIAGEPGFGNDSTGRLFKFRMKRFGDGDSTFTFNYRMNGDRGERIEERDMDFDSRMRGPRMNYFMRHRNFQSFDYNNTGSDGISTHISFRVNDPSPEKIKAVMGSEKAELELKDLNLVPEFSSGKTMLMFSLPLKTTADVKFTDSEGKLLWSDKALNGRFNKSFGLGLNGVYFLQVKQGGKVALKRIVKEE
jgi:hypothetical protein